MGLSLPFTGATNRGVTSSLKFSEDSAGLLTFAHLICLGSRWEWRRVICKIPGQQSKAHHESSLKDAHRTPTIKLNRLQSILERKNDIFTFLHVCTIWDILSLIFPLKSCKGWMNKRACSFLPFLLSFNRILRNKGFALFCRTGDFLNLKKN